MIKEIENKLRYLAELRKNPFTDVNTINRLSKELEYINTAQFTNTDWQLYKQAFPN